MKLKTLKKKIRRLEIRLREGPGKLARLKRKLEEQLAADVARARKKAAARAAATRRAAQAGARRAKSPMGSARAEESAAPVKAKRKLNLSPERRAQLAEAMKARWAARKAAALPKPVEPSVPGDFTPGADLAGSLRQAGPRNTMRSRGKERPNESATRGLPAGK